MAAVAPLEDGRHLNGIVNVLLRSNTDFLNLDGLESAISSSTYTVKIVSILWSSDATGVTLTYSGGTLVLRGGGSWTRFNGFDGILSTGAAAAGDITHTSGNGTVYMTVKKIAGYSTGPSV